MDQLFTKIASRIASWAGQPATFIVAVAIIVIWGVSGPIFQYSDTWQLVVNTATTIVTFLMVFLIQNSQNRDAGAMQAKLDELIRAVEQARGSFIGIEHLTDRQICEILATIEKEAQDESDKSATANDSIARLLKRY